MIHDLIFTVGGLFFTILLIPTLRDRQKPPVLTSAPTAVILLAFAVNYATLGLFFSAAVTSSTASIWAALAYRRWCSDHKHRPPRLTMVSDDPGYYD